MLKAPNPADSWADWEDAHELPWWDDPVSPLDGDGKTLNRKLVAKLAKYPEMMSSGDLRKLIPRLKNQNELRGHGEGNSERMEVVHTFEGLPGTTAGAPGGATAATYAGPAISSL